MYVHGAALRMSLVRLPGCRLSGAYAVPVGVITHELVVACSACARALQLRVDVITRRKGVCTYELQLWDMESRVQVECKVS